MSPPESPRLGNPVPDEPATPPSYDMTLRGEHVTIVPIHPDHATDMYNFVEGHNNKSLFDYLFDEQPSSLASFRSDCARKASTTNPWTYAILLNGKHEKDSRAVGLASLMRMDLLNRVIEVGGILYTSVLQRTPAATEAMYLLARYAIEELGFRRYEWKCNSLNKPSQRAAKRLGFEYEGTFRQHMIAKGRNRDTAWFAMLDTDWPEIREAFEAWLGKDNFDGEGRQKTKLEDFRTRQLQSRALQQWD